VTVAVLPGLGLCECGCGERTTVHNGRPRRYIVGHHRRKPEDRYEVNEDGCWIWQGAFNQACRPVLWDRARKRMGRPTYIFYERVNGPIPAGLELHHVCEEPRCVNPDHLWALTPEQHRQVTAVSRREAAEGRPVRDRYPWLERAQALRQAGHSYKEISRRLEVPYTVVWKALNPKRAQELDFQSNAKRNAQKRAWENDPRNRTRCTECGRLRAANRKGEGLCRPCIQSHARAREETVLSYYRAGYVPSEIAAALGVSQPTVVTLATRLRRRGVDVPDARGVARTRARNGGKPRPVTLLEAA
jgi:DNA-binding CsgD family transcriptional regulator